jgi:hypothetical protein
MKQYLLSMVQPDGEGSIPPPEVLGPIMVEIEAIREELKAQGSWVFGSTITVRDGEVTITDGPFAEGKEHLGGITIIQVADLDEALRWGIRYAQVTTLPIEVRPFQGDVPG